MRMKKNFFSFTKKVSIFTANFFLVTLPMSVFASSSSNDPDFTKLVEGTDENVTSIKTFLSAFLNKGVTGTAITILCWLAIMYGGIKSIGEFFFASDDDGRRESGFKRLLKTAAPAIGGAVFLFLRTKI